MNDLKLLSEAYQKISEAEAPRHWAQVPAQLSPLEQLLHRLDADLAGVPENIKRLAIHYAEHAYDIGYDTGQKNLSIN